MHSSYPTWLLFTPTSFVFLLLLLLVAVATSSGWPEFLSPSSPSSSSSVVETSSGSSARAASSRTAWSCRPSATWRYVGQSAFSFALPRCWSTRTDTWCFRHIGPCTCRTCRVCQSVLPCPAGPCATFCGLRRLWASRDPSSPSVAGPSTSASSSTESGCFRTGSIGASPCASNLSAPPPWTTSTFPTIGLSFNRASSFVFLIFFVF